MKIALTDKHVARLRLLEDGGTLTPSDLLKDARNPESPLHELFTWDDREAAEQHRLDTSRRIIRSVKFVIEYETHTIAVPRYVRNPDLPPRTQGYISTHELRRNPESARQAVVHAF